MTNKYTQPIQPNTDGAIQQLTDMLKASPLLGNELMNVTEQIIDAHIACLDALAFVSLPHHTPDNPDSVISLVKGILRIINVDAFNPAHKGATGFWLSDAGQLLAGVLYNAYTGQMVTVKESSAIVGVYPENLQRWIVSGLFTTIPCPRWVRLYMTDYQRNRRNKKSGLEVGERISYMLLRTEVLAKKIEHDAKMKKHQLSKSKRTAVAIVK